MATTPIGTRLQCATDSAFTQLVKNYDGAYVTSLTTVANELPKGQTIYARAAHQDQTAGWSNWSALRSFQIAQYQKWVSYLKVGDSTHGYFYAVAVDSAGNIYTAGHIFVGGQYPMPYLVKFSRYGNIIWQKQLNVNSVTNGYFYAVAVDSAGNIYTAGTAAVAGTYQALIIRWSSDGNPVWQRQLSIYSYFYAVAVDSAGNIYIAGFAMNSGRESLLVKWAPTGDPIYQRSLSTYGTCFQAIAFDSTGNVYIAGYFPVNTDFQPLLIKMSSTGALLWQRLIIVTNGVGHFNGLAIDTNDQIYTVGYGGVSGSEKPLLAKWSTNGDLIWQRQLTIGLNGYFYAVAVDSAGNIYTAGTYRADQDGYMLLLTKHAPDGGDRWQCQLINASYYKLNGYFNGLAIDANDQIYVAGYGTVIGYYKPILSAVVPTGASGTLATLPSWQWEPLSLSTYDSSGQKIVGTDSLPSRNYSALPNTTTVGYLDYQLTLSLY